MNRPTACLFSAALMLAAGSAAYEKSVNLSRLPPAVQKTVQAQTQGATIKGIAREKENGKVVYELETTAGGKSRDLMIDESGAVLSVEQEVTLDSLPAPAKTAMEKRAAGGRITKVEMVTQGQSVTYEASVKKGLKTSEFMVHADGSPAK